MNRPTSQNPQIGPVDPSAAKPAVTTTTGAKPDANVANVPSVEATATHEEEDLVNIEPIGKEYIESKLEGKILSFYCKLCECQFNDPNAKDMHTKGKSVLFFMSLHPMFFRLDVILYVIWPW